MLGSNVKVHFAGSDGSKENFCALVAADTRYRLYSCYNYIVNKKPDDDFRLPEDDIILEQQKQQKHVIQDSGLFTLMFGASKGQQQTITTLSSRTTSPHPASRSTVRKSLARKKRGISVSA